MIKVKGFVTVNSTVNNGENAVAAVGELSPFGSTFSINKEDHYIDAVADETVMQPLTITGFSVTELVSGEGVIPQFSIYGTRFDSLLSPVPEFSVDGGIFDTPSEYTIVSDTEITITLPNNLVGTSIAFKVTDDLGVTLESSLNLLQL